MSFLVKDKSESGVVIPVPAELVNRLLYVKSWIYCN